MHSFRRWRLVFFLFALLLPCCAVAEPDFDELKKSVVRIVIQKSQGFRTGTGFAINDQGYIATNFHVIADADSIKAIPANSSKWYDVEVVAMSRELDLAVVYSPYITLPPIALSLAPLTIGQEVWPMGYPSGADLKNNLARNPTVRKGIISRIFSGAWHTQELRIIQYDASTSPGDSGGPLLDEYGRAIGVNTQASLAFIPDSSGAVIRVSQGIHRASHIGELAKLLDEHDIAFRAESDDYWAAVWLLLLLVALVMALKKPRQFVLQVSRRIGVGVRPVAKASEHGLVLEGPNDVRIELSSARLASQHLGLSLGRHPDLVDEVVEDETVSRRHLQIVAKGDKFYVEDLNSLNGTFLKTFLKRKRLKRPFKPMRLGDGAEIALGRLVLVASVSQPSQVDAISQANFSVYRIGHGSDVAIQINDRSVSRVHAELIVTPSGSYYLTDCASKNGSYVVQDGEKRRIRQEVISPTDKILLGHYQTTASELVAMGEREADQGSRD